MHPQQKRPSALAGAVPLPRLLTDTLLLTCSVPSASAGPRMCVRSQTDRSCRSPGARWRRTRLPHGAPQRRTRCRSSRRVRCVVLRARLTAGMLSVDATLSNLTGHKQQFKEEDVVTWVPQRKHHGPRVQDTSGPFKQRPSFLSLKTESRSSHQVTHRSHTEMVCFLQVPLRTVPELPGDSDAATQRRDPRTTTGRRLSTGHSPTRHSGGSAHSCGSRGDADPAVRPAWPRSAWARPNGSQLPPPRPWDAPALPSPRTESRAAAHRASCARRVPAERR